MARIERVSHRTGFVEQLEEASAEPLVRQQRGTVGRIVVVTALALCNLMYRPAGALSSERRDFIVKFGVMESATATEDRLRETRTITMDPSRRPGWCFLVDPPTDEPYEVYSVHYLPSAPKRLTGDFKGKKLGSAVDGLKTTVERRDGIRPFCFDFHTGDPLGAYRVEVFVNGALKATLRFQVVAPGVHERGKT